LEFYRYVKWQKGCRGNIPVIKDCNGGLITDPVEKANNLTAIKLLSSAVSGTSQK
jgi:hypothetical protein